MENKKESSIKASILMFIVLAILYAIAYVSRSNYSIAVNTMIESNILSNEIKGVVNCVYFITYAVGQIINGYLADRKSPYKMIIIGSLLIFITQILMATLYAPSYLLIIWWAINGFAQAMLWTPIFFIYNNYLNDKTKKAAITTVAISTPAGKILSYLIGGLSLNLSGWKMTFISAGCLMLLILITFIIVKLSTNKNIIIPDLENKKKSIRHLTLFKSLISTGIIFIIPSMLMHGLLLNGALEWVPTILQNKYNLSSDTSSFICTIIPLIGILGVFISNFCYYKIFNHNAVYTCLTVMSLSFICSLLMFLTINISIEGLIGAIIFTILFGFLYTFQLSYNHASISLIPSHFLSLGLVATVSGFLNAINYAGSAIATYGLSKITDDPNIMIIIFIFSLIVAIIFIILSIKRWNRFILKKEAN